LTRRPGSCLIISWYAVASRQFDLDQYNAYTTRMRCKGWEPQQHPWSYLYLTCSVHVGAMPQPQLPAFIPAAGQAEA
jgi:hypothetical protein